MLLRKAFVNLHLLFEFTKIKVVIKTLKIYEKDCIAFNDMPRGDNIDRTEH